jgi:hypothetical protein
LKTNYKIIKLIYTISFALRKNIIDIQNWYNNVM